MTCASIRRMAPDLIKELSGLSKKRSNIWVALARHQKTKMGAKELCDVYDEEGYSSMVRNKSTNITTARKPVIHTDHTRKYLRNTLLSSHFQNLDKHRNRMYKSAIASSEFPSRGNTPSRWLEIGAGAAALLTQMVLERADDSLVLAVEANPKSAKHATKLLGSNLNYKNRFQVVQGYTTDKEAGEVIAGYAREHTFDALLQEVLGYIATGEGVAFVIAHLKASLGKEFQPVYIPSRVATFYTPTNIDVNDILTKVRNVYVNPTPPARTILVRSLPFDLVTPHKCQEFLDCGCLEFVDFADLPPLKGQVNEGLQKRSKNFVMRHPTTVNSLSFFIWVGFNEATNCTNGRSSTQTQYPYGVSDLPSHQFECGSFSSCSVDGACASNWRNLVCIFPHTLELEEGDILEVQTTANIMKASDDGQPRPEYEIKVYLDKVHERGLRKTTVSRHLLDNLYPTYTTT